MWRIRYESIDGTVGETKPTDEKSARRLFNAFVHERDGLPNTVSGELVGRNGKIVEEYVRVGDKTYKVLEDCEIELVVDEVPYIDFGEPTEERDLKPTYDVAFSEY